MLLCSLAGDGILRTNEMYQSQVTRHEMDYTLADIIGLDNNREFHLNKRQIRSSKSAQGSTQNTYCTQVGDEWKCRDYNSEFDQFPDPTGEHSLTPNLEARGRRRGNCCIYTTSLTVHGGSISEHVHHDDDERTCASRRR